MVTISNRNDGALKVLTQLSSDKKQSKLFIDATANRTVLTSDKALFKIQKLFIIS